MKLLRWISFVVVALSVVLPAGVALSATTPGGAATAQPGQGLEISPPVIEVSANPGQTVQTIIRIRNVSPGVLIASGHADDFGATGEEGQPKLLLDETEATRFSLKYWIKSVPDLTLAPQELKTATVNIAVPNDAEPGGHYGVVRFTAQAPELKGTGVALSASIGSLILLKVNGAITEKLSVAQFTPVKDDHPASLFESGPIKFLVRLKNEGSVHEKARGTIDVIDTLGKKVGAVVVNEKGGNVLPGPDGQNIRKFEQTLAKKNLFGHYTAKLNLTYSNGKPLTASVGFWVIPWKQLAIAFIIVLLLFAALRLGLRRYNAWIISQARRQ